MASGGIMTLLPSLAGARRIALDVETCDPDLKAFGPGPRRGSYICGLALGFGAERIYLPTAHLGGGNVENPEQVKAWARQELGKYAGEIAGTNLIYDLEFLEECWGVKFHPKARFVDIQIAEVLIDENRFRYALEVLAQDYLGAGKEEVGLREAAAAHGWTSDAEVKGNLWRLPGDLVAPYAAGDVDLPLRILPLQLARLEADELLGVFDLECRLTPAVLAMRRHGVRIDRERAEMARQALALRRDACLAKIRELAPGARLMAPESFAEALAARGLVVPKTATGKPSITKEFLDAHRSDPLAGAVATGRRLATLVTSIDSHILEHAIGDRVCCQYFQLKGERYGAMSRFSSATPNNQNLASRDDPADEGLELAESPAAMVRSIYLPEEDEDWLRLDYSQIEFRFLVDCARGEGAEAACQRYRDDPTTDFHALCAELAGMDAAQRKQVKQVNFGTVYGAGNGKLAELLGGVSVEEAAAFRQRYNRALPFVSATFQGAKEWAARHGLVRTVLGRRMRFDRWEPRDRWGERALPKAEAIGAYGPSIRRAFTYTALNRKLQGSAADLMKKAMVDIWEAGLNDVLGPALMTVHDELDFSVPRSKVGEEAAAELRRLMEGAVKVKVPILVEVEKGHDWGHLE
jgi:DNA polymerase I-like protein with 3'-5' exonuclease and polymerase domains